MHTDDHLARRTFRILGVRVDAVQIPQVVERVKDWIANGRACHYVTFTGLHGVSETRKDSKFKDILNGADLVVADGMPVVWLGRLHGHSLPRRVYGPELMETFCRETGASYRHFFLWRGAWRSG
jgi:N-acetylglucosaminyldiphosphoundecaprenol N-acetyl-beta-D-mannosaminyltransferase